MKIVTKIKKLRKVSKPVSLEQGLKVLDKLHKMMNELGATCMGLSAVQIGIPLRVIHINYRGSYIMDFINPVIVKYDDKISEYKEGCLSLPETMESGKRIIIKRPKKIKLRFMDPSGKSRLLKFDGIIGRAIQHEIDHLDGKLIIDYKDCNNG